MSPVYDLIFSSMVFAPTDEPGEFLICCPFCQEAIAQITLPDKGMEFGDILDRGRHTCEKANSSLGQVLFTRGRNPGGKFVAEYGRLAEIAKQSIEKFRQEIRNPKGG